MPTRKANPDDPMHDRHTGEALSETPKQVRARMRRRRAMAHRKGRKYAEPHPDEIRALVRKPIEEWDAEELARGRPRAKDGTFRGPPPPYITREMQQKAFEVFAAQIKQGSNALTIDALDILGRVMNNEEEDDKGRPRVPASVKVDAAKYLIDRVLGKPTQPIKGELDVRLQAILADVMVDQGGQTSSTHVALPELEGEVEEDEE